MKTCPVCQATLFDDMGVCYGCMHEFDPMAEGGLELGRAEEEPVLGRHARPPAEARGPKPSELPWTVRLEMRSSDDPQACWAMELVPAPQARARAAAPATASRATTPSPLPAAGR